MGGGRAAAGGPATPSPRCQRAHTRCDALAAQIHSTSPTCQAAGHGERRPARGHAVMYRERPGLGPRHVGCRQPRPCCEDARPTLPQAPARYAGASEGAGGAVSSQVLKAVGACVTCRASSANRTSSPAEWHVPPGQCARRPRLHFASLRQRGGAVPPPRPAPRHCRPLLARAAALLHLCSKSPPSHPAQPAPWRWHWAKGAPLYPPICAPSSTRLEPAGCATRRYSSCWRTQRRASCPPVPSRPRCQRVSVALRRHGRHGADAGPPAGWVGRGGARSYGEGGAGAARAAWSAGHAIALPPRARRRPPLPL